MPGWTVEDHLEIELEDVREARIRIVGGDVSVTAAPGPARLEVRAVRGGAVDVHHELGSLRVFHPDWAWSGWRRVIEGIGSGVAVHLGDIHVSLGGRGPEATVALTVPPETAVDVSTVSAPVLLSGLGSRAEVKTLSGTVTLNDLRDVVNVKTVSGDLGARGLAGDLRVKTLSGDVTVADGSCRWVEAKTVSGNVLLDLDLAPDGVYEIGTVSGDVGLRLAENPSLLVEAASVSGRVESDFDLRWDDHRAGRKRLRGRLGEGQSRLFVKTVSGDLRLFARREAA